MKHTPIINAEYKTSSNLSPITYGYENKEEQRVRFDLSQDFDNDARFGTVDSKDIPVLNGLALVFTAGCDVYGFFRDEHGDTEKFKYGRCVMEYSKSKWVFYVEGNDESLLSQSFNDVADYVALERLEKEILRTYIKEHFLKG